MDFLFAAAWPTSAMNECVGTPRASGRGRLIGRLCDDTASFLHDEYKKFVFWKLSSPFRFKYTVALDVIVLLRWVCAMVRIGEYDFAVPTTVSIVLGWKKILINVSG